jgi:anti-sigma factor RsiW
MSEEPDTPPGVHSQALLLPWFLAGTLSEFEREAVNAHLSSCRACQVELEAVRESRALVRDALHMTGGPSPEVERRVMQSITVPRELHAAAAPGRLRSAQGLGRFAAVLMIATIAIQASALSYLLASPTRGPGQAVVVASRGLAPAATRLRVVFVPTATEHAIRDLLLALHTRITDGPSTDGAYVIELLPPAADRAATSLEDLSSHRSIVLEARAANP